MLQNLLQLFTCATHCFDQPMPYKFRKMLGSKQAIVIWNKIILFYVPVCSESKMPSK